MRIRWILILSLVLFMLIQHHSSVDAQPTAAQTYSTVYLSPSSYNSTVGSSFVVKVMLNLVSSANISGFDVKLNYTNPSPNPVVTPASLSYSPNIFGDNSSNFVSQECVFPFKDNQCPQATDYAAGWIHFSALSNSGNPVTGPRNALLFSVNFTVHQNVKGTSIIRINTADLGNTGSGVFATTEFIPRATEDAIFSNSGMAAFFNYLPTDTPTVVAGHTAVFDASASFNATPPGTPIKSYRWDFGDQMTNTTANPVIPHTFRVPGNYKVTLNVTDANGFKGSITQSVNVEPALGALLMTVYSLQKVLQSGILVQLYNSSLGLLFENATTNSGGQVAFSNLSPGTYILRFSGQYAKNSTATETIIAGWTTQDSVGIEVDPPPAPAPTPWYGDIIFLGSLAGAVSLFGFGLFLRRRSIKKKVRASKKP